MHWFAEWSKSQKLAFLVDEEGFLVSPIGMRSLKLAYELCREHNRLIDQALERPRATA